MSNYVNAMRQALEALEKAVTTCFDKYSHEQVMSEPTHFVNKTMQALHQAIEQAEKVEPVACKPLCELCIKRGYGFCANTAKTTVIPAAPTAPAQQPLNDFDMRGVLASRLLCWHRLTEAEAQDLICFFEGVRRPTAPAQDLSRLEPWVHGLGKAILRELQAAPAQPAVPPAKFVPDPAFEGDVDEATYASGWNDCRNAMLSAAPAQQPLTEQAWECNECGSQEYASILSEHEVHELGCGNCGSSEWHLADIKGASL